MSLTHPTLTAVADERVQLPPSALVAIADDLVDHAEDWSARVRHDPRRRYYERLVAADTYDAWVVGWAPGQGVAMHEHGGSSGVVAVTEGRLLETRLDADASPTSSFVAAPDVVTLGSDVVHALTNVDDGPATSVHVYSPPLRSMGFIGSTGLSARATGPTRVEPVGVWSESSHPPTVDSMLSEARRQLDRLEPEEALAAFRDGALLVDTRPASFRRAEGAIPGALVVERNVLEWRLDPASPYRLADVHSHDQRIVLFCNEGYASSLAAVSLQQLGLGEATDMVGGFRAWRLAGLPVVRAVEGDG